MRLFIRALGKTFHENLKSFVVARLDGHQHGGRIKVTETSVIESYHQNEMLLL